MRERCKVVVKDLSGREYAAAGERVGDLKANLTQAYPVELGDSKLHLYSKGRKLRDDECCSAGGLGFISLVRSNKRQKKSAGAASVAVPPSSTAVAQEQKDRVLTALQDALETKRGEQRGGSAGSTQQREERASRSKRKVTSIKGIVGKLAIPECLEGIFSSFQELSLIVGFLYHQGLQPTLTGLQRSLPSLTPQSLEAMACLAPGVITMRQVSANPEHSDRVGALHGALAETGTSYRSAEGDSRSLETQEAETLVNLHVPCAGTSPRVPRQSPLESQRLEWKTVTGGVVYGDLVFSKESHPSQEEASALLPSLIQGSRSSSQTIGPAGLASIKSREKGKMASEMKQDVLKLQSYFRQALIELTLILHDDFMSRGDRCVEDHDPITQHCWHPRFLDKLTRAQMLEAAKRNLARSSRLLQKKGKQGKEVKGNFKPCQCANDMGVPEFITHLIQKASTSQESRVAYRKEIPARAARSKNIPLSHMFCEEVARSLRGVGIRKLYSHQESCTQAVQGGSHLVVTTPTASGKSICYNAPILDGLVQSQATALYIFPTKALAQDQLRGLQRLCKSMQGLELDQIGVFDGDTPQATRAELQANARILICNPDILHVTILPKHTEFKNFLSQLAFIVVDEAHFYRGVFGSHVAMVIRRLRRILERIHCACPQFVLSSATIANSLVHAQALTGLSEAGVWRVVGADEDGSPCGKKTFLLWNPPLKEAAKRNRKKLLERQKQDREQRQSSQEDHRYQVQAWKGRQLQKRQGRKADERLGENSCSVRQRLSPIMEMGMLFAECVQHNLKCIAFCKTRKLSELVLTYARQFLDSIDSPNGLAIAAYRAGYSAEHRRAVEGSLFNGNLKGVAATNALELGIDVGALDVTLHLGFPGTVSSLWQQAGRAGRREQNAASIYVAFDGALDQYFMNNPEMLFQAPIEQACIDVRNPILLGQHLACACREHPVLVEGGDEAYFGSTARLILIDLQKRGLVGRDPDCPADPRWLYIGSEWPASLVNLRAIDESVWTVVDEITQEVVEEIEESKAWFQIYEGAVYMQQGKKFLCTHLDMHKRRAAVRRADLKYFTSVRHSTDIAVMGGGKLAYSTTESSAHLEQARHSVRFLGFLKVWQATGKVFDSVDLNLPAIVFDTVCTYIRIPDKARALLEQEKRELRAGVHAAAHALLNVIPLYLMCNTQDVGVECVSESETRWRPERLLIYDRQPGGTGISAQIQPLFGNILRAAYELVKQCPCDEESGCPSCCHQGDCTMYNVVLDKQGALVVLQAVLEAEGSFLSRAEGDHRHRCGF